MAVRQCCSSLDPIDVFSLNSPRRKSLETYEYVVDDGVVTQLSLGMISCRGEGIRCDVQERATAGVCDVEGSNGNCTTSIIVGWVRSMVGDVQRLWSRRNSAFSSGLLLTAPMPAGGSSSQVEVKARDRSRRDP